MNNPRYQRVAIVGAGLIGGSLALALRERKLAASVVAVSRSARSAANLCRLKIVDEATEDLRRGVEGADVVVICSPVSSIASTAIQAASWLAPNALLTDAGSTKQGLVEKISSGLAVLPQPPLFVGSHPLAGGHQTGPEFAQADLFEGAVTVITPTTATQTRAIEAAAAFWQAVGCRIEQMTPKQHDELLAYASHLPHIAAAAVAGVTPTEALPLTATGWGDTTRVAAGSPSLWRDILMANRKSVADGLLALETDLKKYREALNAGDAEAIEKLLEQGRQRRDALGG